jgi:hypothetical protein
MPKIQTSCPNCQQPLVAEIFQVIDVKQEPRLKDLLLAGGLNIAQCAVCGFQGQLPVPLVYHDGEKQLLLTFSPPDTNKTMEEKESSLAPLLKQVTESLAPEERKGYLFQPQAMLTMNNLVKNVLQADGITEEMIQAQQEKIKILDQLFQAKDEILEKEIKDNQDKIDREFFALFADIAQQIIAGGDEESIKKIQEIQDALMDKTEVGRAIKAEAEDINTATQALEALGENLTRSSLLELIISAPTLDRVKAYAGLVRPAMDYEFFTLFTERIEKSESDERQVLVEKRNLLLKVTEDIDKKLEERLTAAKENLEIILDHESLEQAVANHIGKIDQLFLQAASVELSAAVQNNDKEREEKLGQLLQIIQRLSAPPELEVVEALLGVADEEDKVNEIIDNLDEANLSRVVDYLTSIISRFEDQSSTAPPDEQEQIKETQEKLQNIFNILLRKSMDLKMKGD